MNLNRKLSQAVVNYLSERYPSAIEAIKKDLSGEPAVNSYLMGELDTIITKVLQEEHVIPKIIPLFSKKPLQD